MLISVRKVFAQQSTPAAISRLCTIRHRSVAQRKTDCISSDYPLLPSPYNVQGCQKNFAQERKPLVTTCRIYLFECAQTTSNSCRISRRSTESDGIFVNLWCCL